MHLISQILFALLSFLAIFLFTKKIRFIRSLILLGKDDVATDQPARRWRNVFFLALGQKKMFQNPLVALLHLVIYAGFIIINIEVLEIILDGLLGTHRLFLPLMGSVYALLIDGFEVLAAGVILVCIIFLVRRNLLKVRRLASPELDG
ncbi:MAG TPA: hypothetical protein VG842_00110, partial [Sediminibacterium sp.]|nr:hypothetical protein [Sediminibacterium sp.]